MRVRGLVFDNPVLVKHARSRLRPGQAVGWFVIVAVMAACTAWAGHALPWIGSVPTVMVLIGMQVVGLTLGGATQVNLSVGGARASGILDFHRVSPLPPAAVALGFFLGAPIREYLLAAVTMPFAFFAASEIDAIDPWKGVRWLAQVEVAVLCISWLMHGLTMLGCLTRKRPRGSIAGGIAMLFLLFLFGTYGSVGFYFGSLWLLEETRSLNFFGRMVPWLPWLLIYVTPALGFLGLAVSRKVGAERTHALTKPQALACLSTLGVLVLGGLWDVARLFPEVAPFEPTPSDAIMLAAVYVLVLAAIPLSVTITPDSASYLKGLRRAAREGRRRPGAWTDAGSNRVALFAMCAVVLAATTAVINVVGKPPLMDLSQFGQHHPARTLLDGRTLTDAGWLASRRALMSRPIAIGVLTVAYAGLAFQYFSLRTRTSGLTLLALLIFTVWLAPLPAGAVVGVGWGPEERALPVIALSPLPGIALSSGLGKVHGADAIQLAALSPAITLTFLFNYLLVVVQRKIDRILHAQAKGKAWEEGAGPKPAGEGPPAGLD